MNKPLVTVIIPGYNCANYIQYSIESVLKQTYENIELIVVDDGSTDNTQSVVSNYKDKLKYVYQNNGGVSKARNTGIQQSHGVYIAFLDSDDAWDQNKLEIQMIGFEKNPDVNMIFSGFRNRKNKQIIEHIKYEDSFNLFKEYNFTIENIFQFHSLLHHGVVHYDYFWGNIYKYLFLGNFVLPSSVILKKDSLREVGLFNEKYRVAEDTDLFLRYSKSNMIGFIRNPLLYYEIPNSTNLSGKNNLEKLIKNAISIQIDSILDNQNVYEKNKNLFNKGLSMTYSRLAYFYLTNYMVRESRKYAKISVKAYWLNSRSYLIWLGTIVPIPFLHHLSKAKQWGKTKYQQNTG